MQNVHPIVDKPAQSWRSVNARLGERMLYPYLKVSQVSKSPQTVVSCGHECSGRWSLGEIPGFLWRAGGWLILIVGPLCSWLQLPVLLLADSGSASLGSGSWAFLSRLVPIQSNFLVAVPKRDPTPATACLAVAITSFPYMIHRSSSLHQLLYKATWLCSFCC